MALKLRVQCYERRDQLVEIEKHVQEKWRKERVFDVDAGVDMDESYLCSYPFLFTNGELGLSDAQNFLKAEFASRFQRLLGRRVLFPFWYHCNQVSFDRRAEALQEELQKFGTPPHFPSPSERKYRYKKYEWEKLNELGVSDEDIPRFCAVSTWYSYFIDRAKADMKSIGAGVDFRRFFSTTETNPYYVAFVQWHFRLLKKKGKLKYRKRFSIFDWKLGMECTDQNRARGVGVGYVEYTCIKMKVVSEVCEALSSVRGRSVFVLVTLRFPQMLYGQTNCGVDVNAAVEYGAFEMKNGEVYICTTRCARNLSYQGHTVNRGECVQLATCCARDLVGMEVVAPLSTRYETVFVWPHTGNKVHTGSGISVGVPSMVPSDLLMMKRLKEDQRVRKKWHLSQEMVSPFDVIPVVLSSEYGENVAQRLFEVHGMSVRVDADLDRVYDGSSLIAGPHKGVPFGSATELVRTELIARGSAFVYAECESVVMSRSGVKCVVSVLEHYFVEYDDDTWKHQVRSHVKNTMNYPPKHTQQIENAVDTLHGWRFSRSKHQAGIEVFGHTLDVLSNSTIQMAFSTIAHVLQNAHHVRAEQLNDHVFDCVFLGKPYSPACTSVSKDVVDVMHQEFEYWYPLNLHVVNTCMCDGHLAMSLYNHVAVWDERPQLWPKSIHIDGMLGVGRKRDMSTVRHTLEQYGADAIRATLANSSNNAMNVSYDAQTANAMVNRLCNELAWIKSTLAEVRSLDGDNQVRTSSEAFHDRVLLNAINRAIRDTRDSYERLFYHDALKYGHFDLASCRDAYRQNVKTMNKNVILRYLRVCAILISPICPHFAQYVWEILGQDGFIVNARWPVADAEDVMLTTQVNYLRSLSHDITAKYQQAQNDSFDSVDVYVATQYPEVYARVIEFVAACETFPSPGDILKHVRNMVKNKKQRNLLMCFVRKMKASGTEPHDYPPFDEVELIREHCGFLVRACSKISNVRVFTVDDAEKHSTLPGKPIFRFYASGNPPPPP